MIKLIFLPGISPNTGLTSNEIGIDKITDVKTEKLSRYSNIVLQTSNNKIFLINDLNFFIKPTPGFRNYSIENIDLCIYYSIYFNILFY